MKYIRIDNENIKTLWHLASQSLEGFDDTIWDMAEEPREPTEEEKTTAWVFANLKSAEPRDIFMAGLKAGLKMAYEKNTTQAQDPAEGEETEKL